MPLLFVFFVSGRSSTWDTCLAGIENTSHKITDATTRALLGPYLATFTLDSIKDDAGVASGLKTLQDIRASFNPDDEVATEVVDGIVRSFHMVWKIVDVIGGDALVSPKKDNVLEFLRVLIFFIGKKDKEPLELLLNLVDAEATISRDFTAYESLSNNVEGRIVFDSAYASLRKLTGSIGVLSEMLTKVHAFGSICIMAATTAASVDGRLRTPLLTSSAKPKP